MTSRKSRAAAPTAPVARRDRKVEIVYRATAWLQPFAKNSRTHSAEQVAAIARSIETFGFTNPLLVLGDGTIVAGHGRADAAKLLKLAEVPTIEVSGWSDDEVRAYVIADNKLALDAGWDETILKAELSDLAGSGFDLDLAGFGESDLNNLFGPAEQDPPPAPPEIKASYQLLIECDGEAQQVELIEEMQTRGLKCRALIT